MDGDLCSLSIAKTTCVVQMVADGSTVERITYAQTLDHWQGNVIKLRAQNQPSCKLWCYFGLGHGNATSQVRLHGIGIVKALNMEIHVLSECLMSSTNNLCVSTILASIRQHRSTYQLTISFAKKQCSSTCTQFKTPSPGLEQRCFMLRSLWAA